MSATMSLIDGLFSDVETITPEIMLQRLELVDWRSESKNYAYQFAFKAMSDGQLVQIYSLSEQTFELGIQDNNTKEQ
jgi:hypothetical protein